MRCLFVFGNAPLTENYHGAASRYYQAFKALTGFGIEVHVLRFLQDKKLSAILEYEKIQTSALQHYKDARTWRDAVYIRPTKKAATRQSAIKKMIFSPIEFTFPEIVSMQKVFKQQLHAVKPDFVFAEMYPAGALVANWRSTLPWIFGHHDWLYRYNHKKVSSRRIDLYLRSMAIARTLHHAEVLVVKRSNVTIAASAIEAKELQKLGVQNVVSITTSYDSVPWPSLEDKPVKPLRIIHLGQLSTHSNAQGLWQYLNQIAPSHPLDWELHIIGSTNNADVRLLNALKLANARILDHVEKLSTVLRPFDIAIVPFGSNLGERTKIPLLFNHAQVVVAHEAAVAGTPQMLSGDNCILVPTIEGFKRTLFDLANDDKMRQRIGMSAKRTFEQLFTFESQIPKFERVLEMAGL